MEGQVSLFNADTPSGRMLGEPCPATKERTSRRSSRSSSGSQTLALPMCLCLRMGNGPGLDGSTTRWVDGAWPGLSTTLSSGAFRKDANGLLWLRISEDLPHPPYYLTLNIGEKPREPMPTKLSQILEENADPRYRLSARACQGILNRAERRGKELPKELKEALEKQVLTNSGSQEMRDGARLEMDGTEILPPEPMSQEPLTETTTKVPENGGALRGKSLLNEPPSPSRNEPENLGGARESYSKVSEQEHCQPSTINPSLQCKNPWDPQSARVYGDDFTWHSLNATENENTNVTLQAKENGGHSLNCGIVIREKK